MQCRLASQEELPEEMGRLDKRGGARKSILGRFDVDTFRTDKPRREARFVPCPVLVSRRSRYQQLLGQNPDKIWVLEAP